MPLRLRTTASTAPARSRSRPGLPAIGFCLLSAGLVAACLPWPVKAPRLVALVVDEVARSYGIALTLDGGTNVALLPFPRLNVAATRLNAGTPDGPMLAENGSLSLQLGLLAMLKGRIEVDALSLDGAAVTLPMSPADTRWAVPLRSLAGLIGAASGTGAQPSRLSLTRATLTGLDRRDGTVQTLSDVDLSLSSPFWGGKTELVARGTWRGQESRLRISGLDMTSLLRGGVSGFSTTATFPAGSLALSGTAQLGDVPLVAGRAKLATRSLPQTLAWSGGGVALAPLIEDASVEADFRADGREILLPQVKVALGNNRLEGAGSVSLGDERVAIQATLAADRLNVAPLVGDLIGAFGLVPGAPEWKDRPLSLGPFTAGDLDLRLSAASLRIGPVLIEDIASSLIVRDGSLEATIGRANLQGGVVKGRVALATTQDRQATELKLHGAFEELDLGDLLADLGEYRWLVGAVHGTFAVESRAATMGALVERMGGRAAIAADDGTLSGLDLAALIRRERPAASGLPLQRVGRTDFARAGVTFRLKDGLCEISDGRLASPGLTATLGGMVSLVDRRLEARADIASDGGVPARSFEIAGPWNAIVVRPATPSRPEASPAGLAVIKPDPLQRPAGTNVPAAARAYAP